MLVKENGVVFEGPEDQEAFYAWAEVNYWLVNAEDYQALQGSQDIPETIAWFDCSQEIEDPQDLVRDAAIYVNEHKFALPDTDLQTKLIKITVRHEAAEAWYRIQPDSQFTYEFFAADGQSPAHHLALLEEWRYAFELGCQQEYLARIEQWADEIAEEQGSKAGQQFLAENRAAMRAVLESFETTIMADQN